MATKSRTATGDVLDHHHAAFGEGDLAGLLEDYTDDSAIITSTGTFHGLEDIETLLGGMLEEFSQPGVEFVVDERTVDGDVAFVCWHGETPENVYEFGTYTLVVRDGAIATHTTARKATPKD